MNLPNTFSDFLTPSVGTPTPFSLGRSRFRGLSASLWTTWPGSFSFFWLVYPLRLVLPLDIFYSSLSSCQLRLSCLFPTGFWSEVRNRYVSNTQYPLEPFRSKLPHHSRLRIGPLTFSLYLLFLTLPPFLPRKVLKTIFPLVSLLYRRLPPPLHPYKQTTDKSVSPLESYKHVTTAPRSSLSCTMLHPPSPS